MGRLIKINKVEIFDEISNAPTIMSAAQMEKSILALMNIPSVESHLDELCSAVEVLADSYNTGTYFEVTEIREPSFKEFSSWLNRMSESPLASAWQKEELRSLATVFLVFPRFVYSDLKK